MRTVACLLLAVTLITGCGWFGSDEGTPGTTNSLVQDVVDTAGQDAVTEEILRTTGSLVQDIELVVEGDSDSESLAPALEKLAVALELLTTHLEASTAQEAAEEAELVTAIQLLTTYLEASTDQAASGEAALATAIQEAVPELVAALDRLSYMTFQQVIWMCNDVSFAQGLAKCAEFMEDQEQGDWYRSAIDAYEE